jgi:tryptophanyl-tRNA synthetase
MDTVVSGIRPTGNLHLGNYFGALKNFIKMQNENNCYFFIADYHSLTTHPTPADLHGNVKSVLIDYLAAGLDPEKAPLYLQRDLHETSFKHKARSQPDNINAGLLTYPTLMAADIIIHKAHKVPVGKDQEQHLEMTRTFANRFNRLYKVDYFPEPVAYNFGEQLIKIPGLDGSTKMGKSEGEGNAIFLNDEPAVIRKKIMKAVTDSGPTEPNQPKPQAIENIFALMKALSAPETLAHFEEAYNECRIRYGDMKKQLAEDAIAFTEPFREKMRELAADNNYLRRVVNMGKEKAHASAGQTIREVREIIGFKSF